MEKIIITCPFTGMEFDAIKFSDNRIVTSNKITGEEITLKYDPIRKRYLMEPRLFTYENMLRISEVANELTVSNERVCALMKAGKLKRVRIGNSTYIPRASLVEYLCSRKLKEDKQWSRN